MAPKLSKLAAEGKADGCRKRPAACRKQSMSMSPLDDDVLEQCASMFVEKLRTLDKQRYRHAVKAQKRLGVEEHLSACTGTNIGFLATQSLSSALGGRPPAHVWSCDNKPKQQVFLQEVVFQGQEAGCLFRDIIDLTDPVKRWCIVHKGPCPIKTSSNRSSLDCGWSCKMLSKAFSNSHASSNCCGDGDGTTGSTCQAWLDTVREVRPLVLFFENVPELLVTHDE